jgi:hypothetical protein
VPFGREQVMRENYGAWLRAMGLPQAAERLIRPPGTKIADGIEEQPFEAEFLVHEHAGRNFAVLTETYHRRLLPFWDIPVVGLDLSVLEAISTAIETPGLALAELLVNLPSQVDARQESVSIFPDGSAFGWLDASPVRLQKFRF